MNSVFLKYLSGLSAILLFCSTNNLLADNAVMSCKTQEVHNGPEDLRIYRYKKNWLGRKSVSTRVDGNWKQWCLPVITLKAKEAGVVARNTEVSINDLGGSCTLIQTVIVPEGRQYEGRQYERELTVIIDFIALTRTFIDSSWWDDGGIRSKKRKRVLACEMLDLNR